MENSDTSLRNTSPRFFRITAVLLTVFFSLTISFAQDQQSNGVKLQFSDGRPAVSGFENVNAVLSKVGVRTSLVEVPKQASAILGSAKDRALSENEKQQLLSLFNLSRAELLEQVRLAGRIPEGHRGGFLNIKATNGGTYPNISDLQSFSKKSRSEAIKMFGKLHINMSDDGMSIDETMTVISGGEFIWFFVLPDGVISKLTALTVDPGDKAVRVSYPGMVIHAGYFPEKGVAVGFAHGPKEFTIRFNESMVAHFELLNTNPWIDFTQETPKLLESITKK